MASSARSIFVVAGIGNGSGTGGASGWAYMLVVILCHTLNNLDGCDSRVFAAAGMLTQLLFLSLSSRQLWTGYRVALIARNVDSLKNLEENINRTGGEVSRNKHPWNRSLYRLCCVLAGRWFSRQGVYAHWATQGVWCDKKALAWFPYTRWTFQRWCSRV